MAKALLGHLGGQDPRLQHEVVRLRAQVRDLEAEMLRLRAENDGLLARLEDPADRLVLADEDAVLA
jgi:hypothetical protein